MKIFLFLASLALGSAVCLAACNDHPAASAPSTKRVDSVVAAAPDTIKAMPVDSTKR